MSVVCVGIDNGVSGSIGIVGYVFSDMIVMPTYTELNYTKSVRNISRIDVAKLREVFSSKPFTSENMVKVFLERPMVNPGRFQATVSAVRALEATLIVLAEFKFPIQYVDSKQWQKEMLPEGLKGPALKSASRDVGMRLFPLLSDVIKKHGDADGLLMAECARRKQW